MQILVDIKFVGSHTSKPTYARQGDAGVDLIADIDKPITIWAGDRRLIPTGIAVHIKEPNVAGFVMGRSGLSLKHDVHVAQGTGVIDSNYTGEIGVILKNSHAEDHFTVLPGMKIAQLVFAPVLDTRFRIVEVLEDTERGDGGFGHTGL